jgi:hypothetical protein
MSDDFFDDFDRNFKRYAVAGIALYAIWLIGLLALGALALVLIF